MGDEYQMEQLEMTMAPSPEVEPLPANAAMAQGLSRRHSAVSSQKPTPAPPSAAASPPLAGGKRLKPGYSKRSPNISQDSSSTPMVKLSPFEKAIMKLPAIGGLKHMQVQAKKLMEMKQIAAMQEAASRYTVQVHHHCHHHYHVYDSAGKTNVQLP